MTATLATSCRPLGRMAEVPPCGGGDGGEHRVGTVHWRPPVGLDVHRHGRHVDGALAAGVAAQTAQAVRNVAAHLATQGASLADVAKTLCFLTDMGDFATFNEAYVAGFGDHRPARSTIGVAALPAGGVVEIEAWAYKPA